MSLSVVNSLSNQVLSPFPCFSSCRCVTDGCSTAHRALSLWDLARFDRLFFQFPHDGPLGRDILSKGKQLFSRFLLSSFFIQDTSSVSLTPQDSLKIKMRSSSLASAAITAGLLSIIPASRAFPAIKRQLVSNNAEASSMKRGGQLTVTCNAVGPSCSGMRSGVHGY